MGVYEIISKNIRDLRCEKDMSISELAEKADISERNLYRIEAKEIHPGIETIMKLAMALSVEMKLITGDVSEELLEDDANG